MTKRIYIFFVFVVCSVLPVMNQSTQELSRGMQVLNSFGTEFWLCFQRNYKESVVSSQLSDLHLELFITSDDTANVRIEIKGLNFLQRLIIPARTIESVRIPAEAQVKSEEVIEELAIYIRSDKPISVYGLNRRYQTTDTYLALPVEVLGTEYRVMCYTVSDNLMPQFAIVATESNTEVTITPSVNTTKNPANKPFKVFLNKGQVYQVVAKNEPLSKCDLTGTKIVSNKKIAVFSGHQCAYVPPKVIACNHLVEQMPPVPAWGKHFYLGMLMPRSNYTYRVLANEPKTKVFKDGVFFKELNAGEYFEDVERKEIQIAGDKPILVAQYSQGFKNGDSVGDPMMILVSPTQQFLRSYRFATPVKGDWLHYVNIIVPNEGISGVLLDGKPVDPKLFKPLGITRYSIAYVNVPYGSHSLVGTHPFGMYSYGFGKGDDSYDAYGTMGGQSFMEYIPIKDTLPPYADVKVVEENDSLYIIVRDDRVDDTGLREIAITATENLVVSPFKLESGTPQMLIKIASLQANVPGRVLLEVSDVAQNKSFFTVCYVSNPKTEKYEFVFLQGIEERCLPPPGIQVGIFGNLSAVYHSANFSSTDGYFSKGNFSDGFGFGGYAGIYLARKFFTHGSVTLRIIYENYAGLLEAPDSTVSHIRGDNGELIPFQELSVIKLDGKFLKFALGYEHYWNNSFYGLVGLDFSIPLSKSFSAKKKILIPLDYSYLQGSREKDDENAPAELSSLASFNFGAFIGVGFTYPIIKNLNAFAESNFYYPFSNIISDGKWKVYQMNLILGVKVKL